MIRLRPVEPSDKRLLRYWRNLPEVRSWMITTQRISSDEHERWFADAMSDQGRMYRVICQSDREIGLCYLTGLDGQSGVCTLGIYLGEPSARGTGAASAALVLLIDYAFNVASRSVVRAEVLEDNVRAVALYQRVGLRRVGLQMVHREGSHDPERRLRLMEVRAAQWAAQREILMQNYGSNAVID